MVNELRGRIIISETQDPERYETPSGPSGTMQNPPSKGQTTSSNSSPGVNDGDIVGLSKKSLRDCTDVEETPESEGEDEIDLEALDIEV